MKQIAGIILGGLCMLLLESGMKRIDKKPALSITPSRLELVADQRTDPYTVKVAYTLNIPRGFIPACARMVYQPYFLAAGERYDLTPVVVSRKNNRRQEKRLEELTGKQPDYSDAIHLQSNGEAMKVPLSQTVPFEVWMAQAKLRADVVLEACDREKHVEVLTLADGVVWFPMGPGPVRVKYLKEKMPRQKESEFSFLYPAGQYVFNRSYAGNAFQLQQLVELIDSIQTDSTMQLEKIVLTGNASPSGSVGQNSVLARLRAEEMKKFLVGNRHLDPRLIQLQYGSEDWKGLEQLVQQSELPDKKTVLRIIDSPSDAAHKESLLQRLPQYESLSLSIFPELQKVVCIVYYTRQTEVIKVVPE